jgi:hypothetical protein
MTPLSYTYHHPQSLPFLYYYNCSCLFVQQWSVISTLSGMLHYLQPGTRMHAHAVNI